jgi:ribosomal protein L16/L10AE
VYRPVSYKSNNVPLFQYTLIVMSRVRLLDKLIQHVRSLTTQLPIRVYWFSSYYLLITFKGSANRMGKGKGKLTIKAMSTTLGNTIIRVSFISNYIVKVIHRLLMRYIGITLLHLE